MTTAFVDLSDQLDPGWSAYFTVGYVIHQGTVYLSGAVNSNSGFPPTGQTIIASLPAAIRPTRDVHVTLYADPDNTNDAGQDPALAIPLTWAATIHAGGLFSLDAPVPFYLNTAPPVTDYWYLIDADHRKPRYAFALSLGLTLICSWPLAALSDTYPTKDAAPYMGPDFTDVDAAYEPHGTLVHLKGTVRASDSGGSQGLMDVPPDAGDGLDYVHGAEYVTLAQNVSGGYKLMTVVEAVHGGFTPAGENHGFVFVVGDANGPRGVAPPLSDIWPPWLVVPGAGGLGVGNYIGGDNGHLAKTFAPPTPGDFSGSFTISVSDLLAFCQPAPPWFLLRVQMDLGQGGFPSTEENGVVFDLGGYGVVDGDGHPLTPPSGNQVGLVGIQGWLVPATLEYDGPGVTVGAAHQNPTDAIWAASQAATDITLSISCSFVDTSGSTSALISLGISPLYEFRQHGVSVNDIIDLSGANWPGVLPVGGPTTVIAGPPINGIIRERRPVLGVSGGQQLSSRFDIAALVNLSRNAGFGTHSPMAAAIAMAESSGDPGAISFNAGPPPSEDRGLWQLNSYFHPEVSDACAFNPPCAARATLTISSGGTDWSPWATFHNGAYLQYLAEALAVP